MNIVYNPANPPGNKWEYDRSYAADGKISFTITDTGQVQLNTTALAGLNHTGKLSYSAVAMLQN